MLRPQGLHCHRTLTIHSGPYGCYHPPSPGEETDAHRCCQRVPSRPSAFGAPPFPPPRISLNVCHRPPVSESPGLLFSWETHRLLPDPLSQNPPGQPRGLCFSQALLGDSSRLKSSLHFPLDALCPDVCGERGWCRQGLGQSRTSSDKMPKLRHGLGPMKWG